jgi:hypothetical protein
MTLDRWLASIKAVVDYAAGAEDAVPDALQLTPSAWTWALWWGALTLVIVVFCGQASKFIYIDF